MTCLRAQHYVSILVGPNAVNTWVIEVLGDLEVGTCDGCTPGAQPGKGLIPYIEKETEDIAKLLTNLVMKNKVSTRMNLDEVAAPGIAITLQVIEAMQNQSPYERSIVIQKLSHEIAEARAMEEAMIVRRLMLTGRKEGNIAAIKMANTEIDRALNELESEIESVIFEKKCAE